MIPAHAALKVESYALNIEMQGFRLKSLEMGQGVGRQLKKLEHDLRDGVATGVTLGLESLHDLLKGKLLVVVGIDGGGSDPGEELAE